MKNRMLILSLASVICLVFSSISQGFYQWKDENGVVHFADSPPADTDNVTEKADIKPRPGSNQPARPGNPALPQNLTKTGTQKLQTLKTPDDAKQVLGSWTLQAHGREELSFEASGPTKVGFTTDITSDTYKLCKNFGAGIADSNYGAEITSPYGGSMQFSPKNGRIDLVVKNMEDFPIQVLVYTK